MLENKPKDKRTGGLDCFFFIMQSNQPSHLFSV